MDQSSNSVQKILKEIIQQHVSPEVYNWLQDKAAVAEQTALFYGAFTQIPRKTGRYIVQPTADQQQALQQLLPGFTIEGWSIDRLSRVWLLVQLPAKDRDQYVHTIENLFLTAEMNEQVALYSALPVLAFPEQWRSRCAEGIRSNVGDVLQAIMCHNPYPAQYLDEPAWNQMVLKAFFTEKPVNEIVGLDERANPELAGILSDYAHERWAAHRSVNPLLWRCVGPFINEPTFKDIERIFYSENSTEREAAALACYASDYGPAKDLLQKNKAALSAIENGTLTWDSLS